MGDQKFPVTIRFGKYGTHRPQIFTFVSCPKKRRKKRHPSQEFVTREEQKRLYENHITISRIRYRSMQILCKIRPVLYIRYSVIRYVCVRIKRVENDFFNSMEASLNYVCIFSLSKK